MKNKAILLGSALTCAALAASAALPAAQIDPAAYGSLKGRTVTQKAKAKASGTKSSVRRMQAFAGEGCAQVDNFGTLIKVVSEDFSKLTTGSEDNPDLSTKLWMEEWLMDENGMWILDSNNNPIPNPDFEYPWNNMKSEYTQEPGWGVGNAYPAGGMLYMPFSKENSQGKFNSHWLDLSGYDGAFVVEFRARLSELPAPDALMPSAIIVEVAETNGMGPTWDMFEEQFFNYEILTEEWTQFRLVFIGGGPSTLVNIVGMGVTGGMYLDDVTIYSLDCHVKAPELYSQSDYREDSFVLNWEEIEDADSYNVDCWYIDNDDQRTYVAKSALATENRYKVTGTDPRATYYYQVSANKDEYMSLTRIPREIFDIVPPKMKSTVQLDEEGHTFRGGVEPVAAADGYNYFAQRERIAEEDGPFVITREDFTGWTHPLYEEGEFYTKENPADDKIADLWYPTDLKQQGWYGKNFQIYKDYICLCPFFYTATYGVEQDMWSSPEFDLSKDGGKVSVDVKLAAAYDSEWNGYSYCAVGLFNWNDALGDYEQIEVAYIKDLKFDWQDFHVELNGASDRSVIAFFGLGTFGDLYMDDIVISQNYKKGEVFYDPFFFRTWLLADSDEYVNDPTTFEFTVPAHASGGDIHQTAQAVRKHLTNGSYDGEKASLFADRTHVAYVAEYEDTNGISFVADDLASNVNVADGVIYITNPEGKAVSVVSAEGHSALLGNGTAVSYAAPARGVYVVRIGESNIKIAL